MCTLKHKGLKAWHELIDVFFTLYIKQGILGDLSISLTSSSHRVVVLCHTVVISPVLQTDFFYDQSPASSATEEYAILVPGYDGLRGAGNLTCDVDHIEQVRRRDVGTHDYFWRSELYWFLLH